MASINDYKLLHQKCITMFESVSTQMAFEPTKLASLDDMAKARFGFYYVILQNLTPLDEFDEIQRQFAIKILMSSYLMVLDKTKG